MERLPFSQLPAGFYNVMANVNNYIRQSGLDHRLLELMQIRVSQINGCAFCLDMHAKEAAHAGETTQRMVSVSAWREAPYFSAAEKAVLHFAERLTRLEQEQESDDIHEELLQHFSKNEIAYLTLAIAQINSWNRVVKSFSPIPGTHKVTG